MRDQNDQLQDGAPGNDAWAPWHPNEAVKRLAGARVSWCVVGGWALDLWLRQQTRPHHDLEIAVLRRDFAPLRAHLTCFKCFVAAGGSVSALPAHSSPGPLQHQIWVLDEPAKAWRIDIFLEPGDNQTWIFRRDEALRRPRSQMIAVTAEGVPYLKPEGVLIYKAKGTRPKDEMDFNTCAPVMDAAARAWLKNAMVRLYPSHHWIERLDDPSP
jgi:hypothetical protein